MYKYKTQRGDVAYEWLYLLNYLNGNFDEQDSKKGQWHAVEVGPTGEMIAVGVKEE